MEEKQERVISDAYTTICMQPTVEDRVFFLLNFIDEIEELVQIEYSDMYKAALAFLHKVQLMEHAEKKARKIREAYNGMD